MKYLKIAREGGHYLGTEYEAATISNSLEIRLLGVERSTIEAWGVITGYTPERYKITWLPLMIKEDWGFGCLIPKLADSELPSDLRV